MFHFCQPVASVTFDFNKFMLLKRGKKKDKYLSKIKKKQRKGSFNDRYIKFIYHKINFKIILYLNVQFAQVNA